jgi:hypothetical protein
MPSLTAAAMNLPALWQQLAKPVGEDPDELVEGDHPATINRSDELLVAWQSARQCFGRGDR